MSFEGCNDFAYRHHRFLPLYVVDSIEDVIQKGYLSPELKLCATCRRFNYLIWLLGRAERFAVYRNSGEWTLLKNNSQKRDK